MSADHEHAGAISARQQARRVILAAAGAVALVASAAPAAGAATASFGADLNNLPANNTAGDVCSAGIPAYGLSGSQSCMFTAFTELFAPASGTVTAIRVKIGNVTGPMRVNVVRFLYQHTTDPGHPINVYGPFLEAYGPDFTPAPNQITQVSTRLPLTLQPTPPPGDTTSIEASDGLALEVRDPNATIPLFNDSSGASSSTYATYPGPTEQGLRAGPTNDGIPNTRQITASLGVLMSADLDTGAIPGPNPNPVPGPTPFPGPTPKQGPVAGGPAVNFPGAGRVRKGTATIPVQCLVADCSGLISLQNGAGATQATAARKKKHKKPTINRYGSASFTAKVGTTVQVKIKLNRAGRALLAHHKTATVLAKVSFTSGGGVPRSVRITLKR